jgi:hypothetical protein
MQRLLHPRTDRQRQASIALVNVAFVALITWLLAGGVPLSPDPMPTASLTVQAGR